MLFVPNKFNTVSGWKGFRNVMETPPYIGSTHDEMFHIESQQWGTYSLNCSEFQPNYMKVLNVAGGESHNKGNAQIHVPFTRWTWNWYRICFWKHNFCVSWLWNSCMSLIPYSFLRLRTWFTVPVGCCHSVHSILKFMRWFRLQSAANTSESWSIKLFNYTHSLLVIANHSRRVV
jgi:hypothetical protein